MTYSSLLKPIMKQNFGNSSYLSKSTITRQSSYPAEYHESKSIIHKNKSSVVYPLQLPKKKTALNISVQKVGSRELFYNASESFPLNSSQKLCPPIPPNLEGPIKVEIMNVPPLEFQEKSHFELQPGGRYRPKECKARHKVAIIIPFRDRAAHLAVFLHNIHPFLQKQQIDYAIYIVEQAGSGKFNRAMALNVGFIEALKIHSYDCFIFHDIDLIPEDDRNLYTCPVQPRHMSVAINVMQYKLPYNDIFGGVSAMTVDQFRTVNGFSNKFWGWGGEDDDMSNRIKFHGFYISRYPANIARYKMISHKKNSPNPQRSACYMKVKDKNLVSHCQKRTYGLKEKYFFASYVRNLSFLQV
ncbi:Beta-1,4-N-acetylgalactosaminyltransferase bre-4 [Armadillidium nasatum]|uniref:Beta-1,4-N-acetylgalactosaminyltransferase n=1 Tax=Armadillidium nasatum TaxID=96803 RepID=A0A5N5T1P1_9CRUS|nr:Beta-1,4-N-acetylgalactosaminyltransferase bre-4 [Armadillidium nasatum]